MANDRVTHTNLQSDVASADAIADALGMQATVTGDSHSRDERVTGDLHSRELKSSCVRDSMMSSRLATAISDNQKGKHSRINSINTRDIQCSQRTHVWTQAIRVRFNVAIALNDRTPARTRLVDERVRPPLHGSNEALSHRTHARTHGRRMCVFTHVTPRTRTRSRVACSHARTGSINRCAQ